MSEIQVDETDESEIIESEISEEEALEADLTTLREGVITNVKAVRKNIASSWRTILIAIPVLAVILAGMLIGASVILNIIAVVMILASVGFSLFSRHILYARAYNSAMRYLSGLDEMKPALTYNIPVISRSAVSPEQIFDAACSLMDEEWQELVPLLEEQLSQEVTDHKN